MGGLKLGNMRDWKQVSVLMRRIRSQITANMAKDVSRSTTPTGSNSIPHASEPTMCQRPSWFEANASNLFERQQSGGLTGLPRLRSSLYTLAFLVMPYSHPARQCTISLTPMRNRARLSAPMSKRRRKGNLKPVHHLSSKKKDSKINFGACKH